MHSGLTFGIQFCIFARNCRSSGKGGILYVNSFYLFLTQAFLLGQESCVGLLISAVVILSVLVRMTFLRLSLPYLLLLLLSLSLSPYIFLLLVKHVWLHTEQ
ncbi:hypothetical protein F2P56_015276 [Juglans regia]|uniref:Uncharacterized protein n=1 Tax=Juglans regia TaxID=51240 RepID=A0A833XEX5_JUGRE|nr:hypothetical protein F2P56_015276 [Juglans regia]